MLPGEAALVARRQTAPIRPTILVDDPAVADLDAAPCAKRHDLADILVAELTGTSCRGRRAQPFTAAEIEVAVGG
jgi:hypothetical protein